MTVQHAPVDFDHYSGAATLYGRLGQLTKARKALKDIDFDTFVVSGRSGLLMGVTLANSMRKLLLIPQRPHERSHGPEVIGDKFIGQCGSHMLFLDDFTSTGSTMRMVAGEVRQCNKIRAKWVGAYLYKGLGHFHYIASGTCSPLLGGP